MMRVKWLTRAEMTPIDIKMHAKLFDDEDNGCAYWTGNVDRLGYGHSPSPRLAGQALAHRWFYERYKGPIPEGLEIDHLCRHRACCNPNHLEAVTHQENCSRALRQKHRKTHCKRGHDLTGDNGVYRSNGKRVCKLCHAINNGISYHRLQSRKRGA